MDTKFKEGFFDPRRFSQLLLRDLAGGYRGMLITMAAVGGTLILLAALTALGTGATGARAADFYVNYFIQFLYLGGFIVTSLAFHEAMTGGAAAAYLMLPASAFEKLLSKLLATSVGFALGSLVFFTAASAAAEGVNFLVFGYGLGFFNPFRKEVWEAIGRYLILQSVFLAGSIWFRKMAFVKTALAAMVFAFGCAVVLVVAARILLADGLAGHGISMSGMTVHGRGWNIDLARLFAEGSKGAAGLKIFERIGKVLFYGVLAPASWLAAWFKLRETEA